MNDGQKEEIGMEMGNRWFFCVWIARGREEPWNVVDLNGVGLVSKYLNTSKEVGK